jgi:hypothetical protein
MNNKAISQMARVGVVLFLFAADAVAQNQVVFKVDMSAQIASGNFNIAGGDQVQARGQFQGWTGGFWLTNSPGNTNIYSGSYDISDAPGTVEPYKFVIIKYWDDPDSWNFAENIDFLGGNRTFVLAGGAQNVPTVYYDNQLPVGAVPVNPITFQVNMAAQIANGNFNPGNGDQVEVQGDFELAPWSDGDVLTNNPLNTNIYSGTFYDANYPGAQLGFKFVILPYYGGQNYENIDNRVLVEPGPSGVTLPMLYFNNQGIPVPVTFQVDMSEQVALGNFTPGYDYVEAWGTFQTPYQWTGGFELTNDPLAANPALYSGTYGVGDFPGTMEQYKFVVDGGGGILGYERPFSPTNDNRSFTMTSGPLTLPEVYFSDLGPSDVLASNTVVTFSVDMANAVGTDSIVFDPNVDAVYVNGDFLGWLNWDPISLYFYQLMEDNPPNSTIYQISIPFSAGSPVLLHYKYGIDGNDDESSFKSNHIAYIRGTGNYALPLDTFGTQQEEPLLGSVAIVKPHDPSVLPLTWSAVSGKSYQLQSTTNLSPSNWTNWGGVVIASNATVTVTNHIGADTQRYFRAHVLP